MDIKKNEGCFLLSFEDFSLTFASDFFRNKIFHMTDNSHNPQEDWTSPEAENQQLAGDISSGETQAEETHEAEPENAATEITETESQISESQESPEAIAEEEIVDEIEAVSIEIVAEISEPETIVSESVMDLVLEEINSEVSDNNESNNAEPEKEEMTEPASEQITESTEQAQAATSEMEILQVEEAEIEAMETEEAEIAPEDYSGFDKEQLVKLAEQVNRDHDPILASRVIQKIRPLFDALFLQEKNEALEKYVAEGGNADTFEFKHQALEQRFYQAQKGISEKRRVSQEFQTKERAKNLESKFGLLEQLRQLVDDHEHTPDSEKFKQIREEWKKIGPVGQEHAQNLNASFYSLIDRFYSLREIYHNLRDFDRKKNLDLKLELITRIEKLADEPMISKAMKELITIQEEYRTLGPVPNDRFEEIKARLKAAADVIYERRRVFNEERKGMIQEEISLKDALVEKIASFENFTANTVKEWQEKTKELMVLQDEWKAIPGRFREKTADQGKQFWNVFKKYMTNKNEFFKTLDKGRKEVLSSKMALVEEVNSLKDGDDWDGITNRMKQIQMEWRNIAPIFSKEGQKVYDEFKAGIDHFFNRLRDRRSGEDKIYQENLNIKEALCAEIEAMAETGKGDKKAVDDFREKFRNGGHVPMKLIQKINGRFSKAIMTLIEASTEIPAGEKERMKINVLSSRSTYSSEGVKQLKNQEGYIQKRLQQLRKDAGNLEDNVAMFRMSKNAMAMIEDVQKRINLYHMEIKELEAQLREIRNTEKAESNN
jgi:hypothetical protein